MLALLVDLFCSGVFGTLHDIIVIMPHAFDSFVLAISFHVPPLTYYIGEFVLFVFHYLISYAF